MLTPGLYYDHRNASRQLVGALPGRALYPKDNNYLPYYGAYTHTVVLPADAAKTFTVGLRIDPAQLRVFLNYQLLATHRFTYSDGILTLGGDVTIADGDLLQVCSAKAVATYLNYKPGQAIGTAVLVFLNGRQIGAPRILDAQGAYAIDLVVPLGTFQIKTVFLDSTHQTQTFISKKVYTFTDAVADFYEGFKESSVTSIARLYSAYFDSGMFPGQADGDAIANFGEAYGFRRPFDWSVEFYTSVLGGNSSEGIPGLIPSISKGSTTGAIKDIITSVTGYTPVDRWESVSDLSPALTTTAGDKLQFRISGELREITLGTNANETAVAADIQAKVRALVALTPANQPAYDNFTAVFYLGRYVLSVPNRKGHPAFTVDPVFSAAALKLGPDYGGTEGVHSDFTLLQQVRWQLSRDGVKWEFGSVDPGDPTRCIPQDTGAVGPHYFLRSDRSPANAAASPVAVLESDIRKAFTILVGIIHDGFFVEEGEPIVRSPAPSPTDKLQYSWLNPWAPNPLIDYQTGYTTVEATVADLPLTLSPAPSPGQEIVYLNGLEVSDANYTILGGVLTLVGLTTLPTDKVMVEYCQTGPARWHDEFVYAASNVFTLPQFPVANTLNVFVNGKRLDVTIGEYTFVVPDEVHVNVTLTPGDKIDIVYQELSVEARYEDSKTYTLASPPVFEAPATIVPGSLRVYINGLRAPSATYGTLPNGTTIAINYAGPGGLNAINGDQISISCAVDPMQGYNIKVVQGATEYSQGYHFQVNYKTGEIIWDLTKPIPDARSTYYAYYTYFPKDILDQLIGILKPATMRVFLQFTTTDGQTFRPYFWGGSRNPTGNVILPPSL